MSSPDVRPGRRRRPDRPDRSVGDALVQTDAPHGMATTHEDEVHADLPAFLKG
jgi:hypothetical protein